MYDYWSIKLFSDILCNSRTIYIHSKIVISKNPNGGVHFRYRFMVFNTTFNNISVISWRSLFLVEETGASGENHRPAASHWQTMLYRVHLAWAGFELTTLVVIKTTTVLQIMNIKGSYRCVVYIYYHTVTTTKAPSEPGICQRCTLF